MALEFQAAEKPVVLIEQNIDQPINSSRLERFWFSCLANGGSTSSCSLLPWVMTDSGFYTMNGYTTLFKNNSRLMITYSLARPPKASLSAQVQRIGDLYHFDIEVTNLSGVTLSSSNAARVYGLIYETAPPDGATHLTSRVLRASGSKAITNLENQSSMMFSIDTQTLSGVNWANLHPVVFVDYRPSENGAFDMLQAAFEYYPIDVYLPLVLAE